MRPSTGVSTTTPFLRSTTAGSGDIVTWGRRMSAAKLVARNLEREEARANAPGDRLGAGARAQLREDRGQVVFHRVSGEIELRRDFLVPQALRDQPQHVQLARRER